MRRKNKGISLQKNHNLVPTQKIIRENYILRDGGFVKLCATLQRPQDLPAQVLRNDSGKMPLTTNKELTTSNLKISEKMCWQPLISRIRFKTHNMAPVAKRQFQVCVRPLGNRTKCDNLCHATDPTTLWSNQTIRPHWTIADQNQPPPLNQRNTSSTSTPELPAYPTFSFDQAHAVFRHFITTFTTKKKMRYVTIRTFLDGSTNLLYFPYA